MEKFKTRQKLGYLLGPLVFFVILFLPNSGTLSPEAQAVAAVTALMAIWWITEAIPIPATALIPVALFPFLGVMKASEATAPYANHLIFLFLGGFMIAMTMERWNLHRRIAIRTILIVGDTPSRIILGFMLATAVLSMWISNTATAMMMVPIGLSILKQTGDTMSGDPKLANIHNSFSTSLMLGIGYAASIGGVATLIGTPPNILMAGFIEESWGVEIGFGNWMAFALPLSFTMLILTWIYLTKVLFPVKEISGIGNKNSMKAELEKLGPMSREEKMILIVFIVVALGWISRGFINLPFIKYISDSTIAISGALVLFMLPVNFNKGEFLLNWKTAVKIPWDVIILFGGGLSLAHGFTLSGLDAWIGNQVSLININYMVFIGVIVLVTIFLTEITSNTATAAMFIPVLAGISIAINIHPYGPIIAAAVAASFAFMLPVATPPNAIIFGSKKVSIPVMAKTGFFLNLLGWLLITLAVAFFLEWAMNIRLDQIPDFIK